MATNVSARVLLHGGSAAIMAYGWTSLDGLAVDTYLKTQYGGHFQFLTIQALWITFITMVLSLLLDIFPAASLISRIKRSFFMVAMPVQVVVASIYWTLLYFFPSLILPGATAEPSPTSSPNMLELFRIPLKIDLSLHALPALSLLIDFMLFERPYGPKEINVGAPVATLIATLWYGGWVEYCHQRNGTWPYPFLDNPFKIRAGIYVGAASIAFYSFKWINGLRAKLLSS